MKEEYEKKSQRDLASCSNYNLRAALTRNVVMVSLLEVFKYWLQSRDCIPNYSFGNRPQTIEYRFNSIAGFKCVL